jgi:hypothetical protein
VLNAEEADEIATHFATPIGREQRIVIEVKVIGELVLANYTFTDRISDRVPGRSANSRACKRSGQSASLSG